MFITTTTKHAHPITAQIPDVTMDWYFAEGIDSLILDSAMTKSFAEISVVDLPPSCYQRTILLLLLFPDKGPLAIAEKLFSDLNENLVSQNLIVRYVIELHFFVGKFEEIELFLNQNPAIQEQALSLQPSEYLYILYHNLLLIAAANTNLAIVKKFVPTYIDRFKKEHRKQGDGETITTQFSSMGDYCYSCDVFSRICKEIPFPIEAFLTLFLRFPNEFDNYFDRKQLVEQYTGNSGNLDSLLILTNFDEPDEDLIQQSFDLIIITQLEHKLDSKIIALKDRTTTNRTQFYNATLIALTAIRKLISIEQYRNLIIATNIIGILKSAAQTIQLDFEIRKQCTRLLNKICNLSANNEVQKALIETRLGTNYQFYKEFYTPFHNLQFFQMREKAKNKPILPASITNVVGTMYEDFKLNI